MKPPAFRSFIFYGTVSDGYYLFDGRKNNILTTNPQIYAGFQNTAVYNLNTSNVIIDGKIYTLPSNKVLPLNKSSYYLECIQLTTFPQPAFTTNDVASIKSIGNIKALVFYDVTLTEEEVQENLRKLDEYYK